MQEPNSEQQSVLRVKLIAVAIIMSTPIYMLVSTLLRLYSMETGKGFVFDSGALGNLPVIGCIIISMITFVASVLFRNAAARKTSGINGRMRTMMIAMQIGHFGSMAGLVYFLLTGELNNGLIIMGISFTGSIYLFPSTAWIMGEDLPLWEREE